MLFKKSKVFMKYFSKTTVIICFFFSAILFYLNSFRHEERFFKQT